MFDQEFSFFSPHKNYLSQVTADSLHSFHFRSNVPIGRLQSPIVVLFTASQIVDWTAPHERIFLKYFIPSVFCFTATPPIAWNTGVALSCSRSVLGSAGRLIARLSCPSRRLLSAVTPSARFADNSFTDHINCSFPSFNLVFTEP